MKIIIKSSIILFLMIVMSHNVKALESKFAGIRGGYQMSWLFQDNKKYTATDPLNSFYVGIVKDIKLIPLLHISTGFDYMQNGCVSKLNEDKEYILHYLSMPISVKAKIGPVFGRVGIAPSFKIAESGTKLLEDNRADWFDAPFFVGGGVQILIFSLEARYHWGTFDILQDARNQYLQLGVEISF